MPFRKWAVQPVHLCRSTDPEKKHVSDFDTMCQRSLVNGLRQLACVARLADKIFDELIGECRLAVERTERLRLKVEVCQDAVSTLHAKSVKVPVSDLNSTFKFLRREKQFRTVYDMPTQLFLPSNRPPCVDDMYSQAAATPVALMCTIDKYRTDGHTSSELFMVTPVLGGATRKKRRKMLDIETRKPASFSLAVQQESTELGLSEDEVSLPRMAMTPPISRETKSLDRLPLPEEQTMAISLEYPSTLVAVDTSGFSFLRMIRCRRSLIHADFVIKRKKDKHKSKRRHTICEGSSKELEDAVENIAMVNTSCQTEGLPESGSFFSLRRSFCRRKPKHVDSARRETVALDSLDLDTLRKNNGDNVAPTYNERTLTKKDSTIKKVGKASSLMSRAANFNPISTLSAALSMAVKMRHKSGKHDDGRSSSGNWSASSSTRASVDSDPHHVGVMVDRTSNISRNSAGKDSVISDVTQQESVRSQDFILGSNLNQSFKVSSSRAGIEKGTRQWDFDRDKGRESNNSTPERSSDCASTPLLMSPYTSRRHPNSGPPTTFDDGESSVYSVDTDGYYTSMHTDSGLWHNVIQSLKNGDNPYGDSIRCRRRQESQSSISTIGNSSINSFLSKTVTEKSSNNGSVRQVSKSAPEPPPRTISYPNTVETNKLSDEDIREKDPLIEPFDKESSPLKNGSTSESDHEVGDRIRVKTTINSSRYPSMCAVSPETSDDELSDIEKGKPSNISIVVAEVHQEEKSDISKQHQNSLSTVQTARGSPAHINQLKKSEHVMNMYGNQSPVGSPFELNVLHTGQVTTSTPKKPSAVSSFSAEPDIVDTKTDSNGSKNIRRDLLHNLQIATQNISSIGEEFIVTSPPVSPKNVSRNMDKTLIPLKYAQRITVTPIVRNEIPENITQNSPKINSPTTRSKNFLKNPLGSLSFLQADNSKCKSPSYISFQSPDSPVSSSTSLSPTSPAKKLAPTTRSVARVTLDPSGKVIYSSSSLDRPKREENVAKSDVSADMERLKYATLPKYQSPMVHVQTVKDEPKEVANFSCSPVRTLQNSTGNMRIPQMGVAVQATNLATPPKTQNLFFRPSRGGRFCRTYFPSHLISSQSKTGSNYQSLSSPPSPSSSVKSVSSTSSQSSHGSKQPVEYHHQSTTPNAPNTSTALQNQRFGTIANTAPTNINQPLSDQTKESLNILQSPYSPYTTNNASSITPTPTSYTNNASPITPNRTYDPQVRIGETDKSVPLVPFKYHQFRPMHFPQEMHATTTHYTASVPRIQSKYSIPKPPQTVTYSQLLHNKSMMCSNKENSEIFIQENKLPLVDFAPSNPPDVIPSSSTPPSTLDITSRTVEKDYRSPISVDDAHSPSTNANLKSLTPKELFAIIHDSKRKHNIKTESEKSLSPLSSRSNSPSIILSSPPIKFPKIETGTFTKQNERWSTLPNVNKGNNLNSPEKSTTHDRIPRTKPTSLRDFKMLLLQTRVGSNEPNSRPSAAELLKVSPPKTSSPQSPISRQLANSQNNQSSPLVHVTIPVKRNLRTRSPYLTRYDSAYPPIWEDCSEDLEADENQNQINYVSNMQSQSLPGEHIYSSNPQSSLDDNNLNKTAASTWV